MKNKRRLQIRAKRLAALKFIREFETVPTENGMTLGGYLEVKNGESCLRFGDTIEATRDGTFRVLKSWMRPGKHPFDPALYGQSL